MRVTVGRVLAAALVAALAGAGWVGHGWHAAKQSAQAREQAVATARQFVVDFVSVSAATVDQDLARVAVGATGEFGEEFQRGLPAVRAAVLDNRVESTGTALRAGLVSSDADSAVVLVAADATVKNAAAPQGRVAHYRIQLDLARDADSGAWLVAKLQFVG
jgi:Mce-associated membrane protein